MADSKQVQKRNFFRFSKTQVQTRGRVDSHSSVNEGGKRLRPINKGGKAASAAEKNKRPRFSSINNGGGVSRPSKLNIFGGRKNSMNPSATTSLNKNTNNGNVNRQSLFNIGLSKMGRKSHHNKKGGAMSRSKANQGGVRRSTTNLFNLFSKDSEKKKEVHVVNPGQVGIRRTPWQIRFTLSGRKYYWNTKEAQHSWDKPEELMSAQEREDAQKDWVWVPHPINYWQPAVIIARKSTGGVNVRTLDHKMVTVGSVKVMKNELTNGETQRVPMTPLKNASLETIVEDLVELEDVNEGLVLHNTRMRFQSSKIYTWIGPSRNVLLAVNPYEDLGLYTEEYKKKYEKSATSLDVPKPHVFGVAATCVHKLGAQGRSQSILVSGESGSGKTQATKQCLDFITYIAGSTKVMPEKPKPIQKAPGRNGRKRVDRQNRKQKKRNKRMMPGMEESVKMVNAGESNSIEDKILKCNPIMEAFGNAKTVRNNNSSRFGKWIVMYMNMKRKQVTGAKIDQFLLETTRVISQAANERNYHVFYQVFTDENLRQKYDLTSPNDYHYINQGQCFTVEGKNPIDDKQEYEDVKLAMDKLNFEDYEKDWFFKIVCAVLHLGNINFENVINRELETNGSAVKEDDGSTKHLNKVAEILEMKVEDLVPALTTRTIRTSKDQTTKALTAKHAVHARDALAKSIYGRLFAYLIERINQSFGKPTLGRFIGILDIFGFESFKYNSFEQLCINFTNERLQKLFNTTTFLEEQELYQMERIQFEKVAFADNKIVLDILDTRPNGTFNLLDDECNVPKGNTMNFLKRVNNYHVQKVKQFKCDQEKGTFQIIHFAGPVTYTVDDFMDKNKDAINLDLYEVLGNSEDPHTKALFPPLKENETLNQKSTSGKFREQLSQLLIVLEETMCHYIRCIKPNDDQSPKVFNGRKTITQFKFSAIIDSIETRKKGFAHKMFHDDFFQQYSCVNGVKHKYNKKRDIKGLCKDLVTTCFALPLRNLPGIQVGETRVLFKTEEYKFLELNKTLTLLEYITKVQARFRGMQARKFYNNFRAIGKELEKAIKEKDLAQVEKIEKTMTKRLGKLGKRYRVVPRNLEKAKRKIMEEKLWDPVKEKLKKYDTIKIKKGEDDEEDEIDDEVMEQLDEKEMEEVIRSVLEVEEDMSAMPFEIRHSLKRVKTLRKILHSHNLNKQFADILNLGGDDSDAEDVDMQPTDKRKTMRQQDVTSGVMVKVDSPEEFAQKDMKKTIQYIETEGNNALKDMDRDTLKNVAVRAAEYDYESETVEKIKKMLKMPEVEFIKNQIATLKKGKDKQAVFELSMQLKEATLIEDFDKYKYFHQLSTLRNPPEEIKFITCFCIPYGTGVREQSLESAKVLYGESAQNRLYNKKRKFLVWQNDDFLFFSLLRLPVDLEDLAFNTFEQIFAYMEEFRSEEDGLDLIKCGVFMGGAQNSGLRNEIFAQIVKQLISNPTAESRIRGVELLGLCLASFPPDDEEFENFLFTWMRLHLPYAIFRNYMSAYQSLLLNSNPNSTKYNGANQNIKDNTDLSEIRFFLDQARETSRATMREAPDKWMIPPGMFKNILSDYDIDEDFLEGEMHDDSESGSGSVGAESSRSGGIKGTMKKGFKMMTGRMGIGASKKKQQKNDDDSVLAGVEIEAYSA